MGEEVGYAAFDGTIDEWVDLVLDDIALSRYLMTLYFCPIVAKAEWSLDVGCFVGKFTSMLPTPAIGLDINPDYIQYALGHYKTRDTQFALGDATDMEFPDNFFYNAYVLELLEHVKEPEKIMDEVVRVVKPEGNILVSVPAPGMSFKMDPKEHLHDFQPEWFTERFQVRETYVMGTEENSYHLYIIRNKVK